MSMFERVNQAEAISAETIARHQNAVPQELAAVWREQGAGLIGDGFVRVVDPDRALSMLDGVVGLNSSAVPVFTTALADVIVYIVGFPETADTTKARTCMNSPGHPAWRAQTRILRSAGRFG